MSSPRPLSPLLDRASPLSTRQRNVVERVSLAERQSILSLPSDDALDPKRRSRVEATRDEMFGQPDAIISTLARNVDTLARVAAQLVSGRYRRAYLVGAGDSLAVMMAARSALEATLGFACEPMQSLDFAYYNGSLVGEDTVVIALSSSGETTRTVEALLVAQAAGAFTLGVTNSATSTLAAEARHTLLIDATRVGWPTQSSTAALALLLRLASISGGLRSAPDADDIADAVAAAPELMRSVLAELDHPVAEIAALEVMHTMHLFSGGGPNLATAIIGAAKVKECSPDHALPIQVEEYHHYNSQKAGEPLWLFAPAGPTVPRAIETGTDAHRWGGQLYAVTTRGETAFDDLADRVLYLPVIHEYVSPLLYLMPAQLYGYHLAMAKFAVAESGAHA